MPRPTPPAPTPTPARSPCLQATAPPTTSSPPARSSCSPSTAPATPKFDVGSGVSTQYIYKTGYVYQSGAWQPLAFTSPNALIGANWYPSTASANLASTLDLTAWQYAVGYVCNYVNSAWKCGCSDAA